MNPSDQLNNPTQFTISRKRQQSEEATSRGSGCRFVGGPNAAPFGSGQVVKRPGGGGGMVDEALAIMAILASHQEGKSAIGQADPITVLLEVTRTGSPRNRENGKAVLWLLCMGDVACLKTAKELGAEEALRELSENGTDRAKRKAKSILEMLQRVDEVITRLQIVS